MRLIAPDSSEWEVRSFRVRMPPWRQFSLMDDGPPTATDFDAVSMLISLITLPFTMVLIPLAIALVEIPVAAVRALGSDVAWVEAATHFPAEERMLWRTTRADMKDVRAAVAAQLSNGEPPRPPRAELVEHVSRSGA